MTTATKLLMNCLPYILHRGSIALSKQCPHFLTSMRSRDLKEVGSMGWLKRWFQHGTKFWAYQSSTISLWYHLKNGILISQNWLLALALGLVRTISLSFTRKKLGGQKTLHHAQELVLSHVISASEIYSCLFSCS